MSDGLFGQIGLSEAPAKILGRRDRLTFRGNVSVGRHGWLRLTPAYSLGLVKELLKSAGPDEFVLEPFCGTGTTALACSAMGIPCHAVDINPFLVWLGNLKLSRYDDGMADRVRAAAFDVASHARNVKQPAWKPDLHQIEKWWDLPVADALAALHDGINHNASQATADLLKMAFCRTMIESANVSFGHQSMSFKKKEVHEPLIRETPQERSDRLI